MQESARAALSHIRQQARELGIPSDFLAKQDLHIHVPAGAIPKDGPSAGVTMATAIVSAARAMPVEADVAMTGEITLSGLVLPVGGIREKALAARRHGIRTIRVAGKNRVDLAELPAEVREDITFVPVDPRGRPPRRAARQCAGVAGRGRSLTSNGFQKRSNEANDETKTTARLSFRLLVARCSVLTVTSSPRMPPSVVFYISGHGFGHAIRQIAVINALHAAGARCLDRGSHRGAGMALHADRVRCLGVRGG